MEKIKILVVEDNLIIGNDIASRLQKAGYQVPEIIDTAEGVLEYLKKDEVDLLLLDITLAGPMDGIQLGNHVNSEFKIPFIYLTANLDPPTFSRAKQTRPLAFITKPFKAIDLLNAIELANDGILSESDGYPSNNLTGRIPYLLDDRIFVKYRDRMVKLFIEDILYIEAERSYCKIFTADKEFLLTAPLAQIEKKLFAPHFLRIHRSYLINLKKVESFNDAYAYIRELKLPISKNKRSDFLKRVQLF